MVIWLVHIEKNKSIKVYSKVQYIYFPNPLLAILLISLAITLTYF